MHCRRLPQGWPWKVDCWPNPERKMSDHAKALRIVGVCAIVVTVVFSHRASAQQDRFVGDLVLKDNDAKNGRNFELVEPFGYIDPNGVRWQAEKGLVTDGASIPQVLWSVVGGPYEGNYRRAAIIHDFYCDRKYRNWERVHRVFYDAMLTGGVNLLKAKLMYYAVWRFGPRWSVAEIIPCVPNPQIGKFCADVNPIAIQFTSERPFLASDAAATARQELNDVASRIEKESLTVEQLQQAADSKPTILRQRTFVHQELTGPNAASLSSFDNYNLVEQSSPLPLPQDLPKLFSNPAR
jgi:hypothetical protein